MIWKENVLEINQAVDDMVNIAEEFYQNNPREKIRYGAHPMVFKGLYTIGDTIIWGLGASELLFLYYKEYLFVFLLIGISYELSYSSKTI